jgi:hypothetical protein
MRRVPPSFFPMVEREESTIVICRTKGFLESSYCRIGTGMRHAAVIEVSIIWARVLVSMGRRTMRRFRAGACLFGREQNRNKVVLIHISSS